MRLFFSIAIPENLRSEIIRHRDTVKRTCFTPLQLQRMRWIDEKQYHVTQYFVGEVPEQRLDELKQSARSVIASTRPFSLSIDHLEFKPRQNPRLLWLRFKSNDVFAGLQLHLHNALVATGFPGNTINDNPIPHVTLIRLKQTKPSDNLLPVFPSLSLDVTQIDLMQSFTNASGAEYRVIESFGLAAD